MKFLPFILILFISSFLAISPISSSNMNADPLARSVNRAAPDPVHSNAAPRVSTGSFDTFRTNPNAEVKNTNIELGSGKLKGKLDCPSKNTIAYKAAGDNKEYLDLLFPNNQRTISKGQMLTFRGPASAFAPKCILKGQTLDSDKMYSVGRIVTKDVQRPAGDNSAATPAAPDTSSPSSTASPASRKAKKPSKKRKSEASIMSGLSADRSSGRALTIETRLPSLNDVYSSGSVKFTRNNVQSMGRMFGVDLDAFQNQPAIAQANLDSANRDEEEDSEDESDDEEDDDSVADDAEEEDSNEERGEDYWAWERQRDAAEKEELMAALRELENEIAEGKRQLTEQTQRELAAAQESIAELDLAVSNTVQTQMVGWNLNREGTGAVAKDSGFNYPFSGHETQVNCSECYFGISFGMTIDIQWDNKNPMNSKFELSLFADVIHSYRFGFSFLVPKPQLYWSKLLYTIPILKDHVIAMAGPVPIIVRIDLDFKLGAYIDVPVKLDSIYYSKGASRTTIRLIKDAANPGGLVDKPQTVPKESGSSGSISPQPLKASFALKAKLKASFERLASLDFSMGPAFIINTRTNNLGDKEACQLKATPQIAPPESADASNPVVGASAVTATIKWKTSINLSPVDITIFSFTWKPWTIRLYAFPSIILVKLFELCVPIRQNVMKLLNLNFNWKLGTVPNGPTSTVKRLQSNEDYDIDEASYSSGNALPLPTQFHQRRRQAKVSVFVEVQ